MRTRVEAFGIIRKPGTHVYWCCHLMVSRMSAGGLHSRRTLLRMVPCNTTYRPQIDTPSTCFVLMASLLISIGAFATRRPTPSPRRRGVCQDRSAQLRRILRSSGWHRSPGRRQGSGRRKVGAEDVARESAKTKQLTHRKGKECARAWRFYD